tara:strand:- start:2292 stop:3284 length:993 start_codon:yes stop_codon:yes gene_type:complete
MIIKSFEIKNYFNTNNIFLFYGENTGLKEEILDNFFKKNHIDCTFNYSEKEILVDLDKFYDQINSKSFFDDKKLIIISNASDKIKDNIENIIEKKLTDVTIILISNVLEKKSKLRNLFEKKKDLVTVPFYKDNYRTLADIVSNFLKKREILSSQETINIIIEKASGDRKNLKNELTKIENFLGTKKKLSTESVLKLTNLSENYSIQELVNNSLARNKKDTLKIINENNFSFEDCMIITRSMLYAANRLLKLLEKKNDSSNLETLISNHKPPIFWKDKEIIKNQIKNWKLDSIKNLIFKINKIELIVKKNSSFALNIVLDFLMEECLKLSN